MVDLSDKSVVICSIVRDAASQLERNIPVIEELCKPFSLSRVVVYENDSIDRTIEILERWKQRNPSVYVISEKLSLRTVPMSSEVSSNPYFSFWRIEKMARYRNHYLDFIESQGWDPDYLVVVDLDVNRIYKEGVLASFAEEYDWDVVTAFGYSLSPHLTLRYHDAYALVESGRESCPQTEDSIAATSYAYASLRNNPEWKRVYSAFGGLAIYKYKKLRGLRYCVLPNADSRVEARSEHFGLLKQMHDRGETKVYLNPRMLLHYQKLTFKVAFNYFARRLAALFR